MSNEFKWTDERVIEFEIFKRGSNIRRSPKEESISDLIEQFKASKQVKGWEVQVFGLTPFNGGETILYGRHEDGKYHTFHYSETYMLNCGLYSIHSVKRLSDGIIFTVGEQQSFGKISSFFYHENELWFSTNSMSGSGLTSGQFTASCLLKPTPKPILITQDGKEIFDSAAKLYSVLPKAQWEQREVRAERAFNYKNWLHFSTRAAAEEYVQEFKPQYSLNDFRKAYNAPIPSPLFDETVEKLIAKSKL